MSESAALHVALHIRSLAIGGAERQVAHLVNGLAARGHQVDLYVLRSGALADEIAEDVALVALEPGRRWQVPIALGHMAQRMRQTKPDILYTMLPGANLVGAVMRSLTPGLRHVAGVRAQDVVSEFYNPLGKAVYAVQRPVLRRADVVITNAASTAAWLRHRGVVPNAHVVPNGIDTTVFTPDHLGRERLRREWGVDASSQLVGLVGRLDPVKGHELLLQALPQSAAGERGFRAVFVGDGPQAYVDRLRALAKQLGVEREVIWAGNRHDMAAVYSSLDVLCAPSTSESFPNVVAEAMACGTPCVTTDVGDAGTIVGSCGLVVHRRDPDLLRAAIEQTLRKDRQGTAEAARQRIVRAFGIDSMIRNTEHILQAVR